MIPAPIELWSRQERFVMHARDNNHHEKSQKISTDATLKIQMQHSKEPH